MSFSKKKYIIVKNAISPEMADFIYKYFLLKRQVASTLFDSKYISPFTTEFGVWNDGQVPNTYSHYGDIAMETLLVKMLPLMQKATGLKLTPNYSCEISTTMNLGGDDCPIYLEPSGKEGLKGIRVDLKPGDMLIYNGNLLEHWREPFNGENCAQVFLHYNNVATEGSKENLFDRRPHLGLPNYFKK